MDRLAADSMMIVCQSEESRSTDHGRKARGLDVG